MEPILTILAPCALALLLLCSFCKWAAQKASTSKNVKTLSRKSAEQSATVIEKSKSIESSYSMERADTDDIYDSISELLRKEKRRILFPMDLSGNEHFSSNNETGTVKDLLGQLLVCKFMAAGPPPLQEPTRQKKKKNSTDNRHS